MPERILIASDHAGFALKEALEHRLADLGFEVDDLGADSAESTDYADYAHPLARARVGRRSRSAACCSAAPDSA